MEEKSVCGLLDSSPFPPRQERGELSQKLKGPKRKDLRVLTSPYSGQTTHRKVRGLRVQACPSISFLFVTCINFIFSSVK